MLGEWMESEVRQQPEILRRGAASYRGVLSNALEGRKFDQVLLAARGSSDNAALYGRYLIEVFLGIPVCLAAPSVLTRYHRQVRYTNCLAIGISQSGAAPDISEVLSSLRDEGQTTLAITNTPGSRITTVAEHSLFLDAGVEKSVAATKTYTASLLALYEIVRVMGGKLPAPSAHLPNDKWVDHAFEAAQIASGSMVRNSPSFALGRGFGFSTAQETALKMMECALIPCKSYSSADFEHGPKALAGHGSTIVSFDGPMPDLHAQGCEIVVAPEPPNLDVDGIDRILNPVWDIIFGQWLALISARARGLNPDVPQYIHKVTETL
ncbi:MAG: SIS domain-containing protein [Fimbriimonas sp.]|nr:SIS domain-containing protein [Fimbriimonas sp.]